MIQTIIIVLLVIISLVLIIYQTDCFIRNKTINKKNNRYAFSIKESLDLTELPIITFKSNNFKLNLLVDTGSNTSFINIKHLKKLKFIPLKGGDVVSGLGGIQQSTKKCVVPMQYDDIYYNINFCATDLTDSFEIIKKENGVTVHGILGNDFLIKHKYILDYVTQKIYVK